MTRDVADRDADATSGVMNTAKPAGVAIGLAMLYLVSVPDGTSRHAVAEGYATAFVTIAVILLAVAIVSLGLPTGHDDDHQRLATDR